MIYQKKEIREDFLGFVHCTKGLTREGLSSVLLEAIKELSLDIQDCRGQGYDGAGSVAGCDKGLSARILRINPKALYTHCHSHGLILCVSGSCSIQCVRNVMLQIKGISYFFKSFTCTTAESI